MAVKLKSNAYAPSFSKGILFHRKKNSLCWRINNVKIFQLKKKKKSPGQVLPQVLIIADIYYDNRNQFKECDLLTSRSDKEIKDLNKQANLRSVFMNVSWNSL